MTHPADQSNPAGMLGMFGRAAADYAAYRQRQARVRQIKHELYSFSERDLNDLGICRADIPRIANSAK